MKRTYCWLTAGWVVYNLTLIVFLGGSVRWSLYRFLRDNVSGLLMVSLILFIFLITFRIVLAARWGDRLRTVKAIAMLVGRVLLQLLFMWIIAFSSLEFLCTTHLAHAHEFEPFGKSIVFHRHDCIPDGNETVYIRHKYSPFLTKVGFRATPIADGYHTEYYSVEGNLLHIEMVDKTVVYDLESGAIINHVK